MNTSSNGTGSPTVNHIIASGASIGDASAQGAGEAVKVVVKTTITDNERETLTKAFTSLFGVVRTMGKGGSEIPADYLINNDSLGQLVACAHRVWVSDGAAREKAAREAFSGKVDAKINEALAKRGKALSAYNALPAELKSEMPAPSPTVSLWVEDFIALFGKGYDLARTTKTLHDMGYMVHAQKADGRRKDQPTPPYITATVGQPIRTEKK